MEMIGDEMNFIHVFSKETAEKLKVKNFNLVTFNDNPQQICWIFENKPISDFSDVDKRTYMLSNKMTF